MAYLKNLYEEDPNLQQQRTSGETTNFAGGSTGTPAAPAAGAAAPQTGWTNLQQYLDVNKGQVGGLADQVTGDINGKVDTFKTASSADAVADINKQAGDDAAKSIQSNIVANADQAKGFLGQQVNVNQDDYTSGVRNTGAGLKDTLSQVDKQDYQQGNVQKLNNQKGNYSSGFGALDSFLLFGDQGAKDKLQQVKGRTGEVDSKIGSFTGDISGAVTSAKDKLEANKRAIKGAVTDKYGNILGGAQGRVEGAKASAKAAAEAKAAEIFAKKKSEYAGFINDGADGDQGFQFIKGNDKFGVNNVVNDDEVAALNSLAGIDGSLGLGTVTKDNSAASTLDEGGWEGLLRGMGETRKAKQAEEAAAKKAAEEAAAKKAAEVETERVKQEQEKAAKVEADRLEREELDKKNAGAKKLLEKQNAVVEKVGAWGSDISDLGKQVINAPGGAWNALTSAITPEPVRNKAAATVKNLKKGKVKW